MRVKGEHNKEEIIGLIYRIPCECGAAYIGKLVQEHKQEIHNCDTKMAKLRHSNTCHDKPQQSVGRGQCPETLSPEDD